MNITTVGIDLAKSVFQVHGVDQHGKVVQKKRLKRSQVLPLSDPAPRINLRLDRRAEGAS